MRISIRAAGVALLVFLQLLILGVSHSPAQKRDKGEKAERVEIEGTLQGMVQGYLKVESAKGEVWVLKLERSARGSRLVGSADPSWLRPGMVVRFDGLFNKQGEPVAAVKQLTVFTPGKEDKPGIEVANTLGPDFSFAEDKPQTGEKPISATVVGAIRSIRGGKLTVAAGRVPVTVPVAENATIAVDIADLRFASIGDAVKAKAKVAGPGKAIAGWVQITAAKKLAVGGGSKPRGEKGKGAKGKAAEDAEK